MFFQPKDPNNKNKPAFKNINHNVTEQTISYLLVSKNNEMMTNELLMLDRNLHKNHLYSTFVLLLTTEQNTMTLDIEVEVLHGTTLTTESIEKIDTVLHLEIDSAMTKVLLLHNTLDHDTIIRDAILDLIALHTDVFIDLLIDTTPVLDTNHAPIQETIILQTIQILTDHLRDHEILDFLDPVHTQILTIKSI